MSVSSRTSEPKFVRKAVVMKDLKNRLSKSRDAFIRLKKLQ